MAEAWVFRALGTDLPGSQISARLCARLEAADGGGSPRTACCPCSPHPGSQPQLRLPQLQTKLREEELKDGGCVAHVSSGPPWLSLERAECLGASRNAVGAQSAHSPSYPPWWEIQSCATSRELLLEADPQASISFHQLFVNALSTLYSYLALGKETKPHPSEGSTHTSSLWLGQA